MTVLPSYCYRDPAEVYERKEERSCKGCAYEKSARLMGTTHTVCTKLLPGGKRQAHGRRCQSFMIGEK